MSKDKAKPSAFKKGVIIYSAALALLAVVALSLLWALLDSFQKSDSDATAAEVIASIDKNGWMEYLNTALFFSNYEEKDSVLETAYGKLIEGKKLVCLRKAAECDENTEVFNVRNGDVELCKLVLKKDREGLFGFARWGYDSIKDGDKKLSELNKNVGVLMPKDSALEINGVLADTESAEESVCPFNAPGNGEPKFIYFSFKEPWGDYDIKAVYNGEALTLTDSTAADYVYDIDQGKKLSCTVTVPSGAELYLDGERLSTDYIKESNAVYPGISPLEAKLENVPTVTVYNVNGLYGKPDLKALYGGTELQCTEDGENHVFSLPLQFKDYSLSVPAGAKATVNGIALGEDYISQKGEVYGEVEEYKQLLVSPKTVTVYSLNALMYTPEITVCGEDGTLYKVHKVSDTEFVCYPEGNADISESFDPIAKDFAVAMAKYTMEGSEFINGNMTQVLGFIKKGSQAYKLIKDSYSGMMWQMTHSLKYNDIHTENYVVYADNAFSCEIHYNVTGYRNSGRADTSIGIYKVLCIESNGKIEINELSLEQSTNNE